MKRSLTLFVVALTVVLGLSVHPVAGQSPAVPSPSEFHGYELGTRYTITAALYDYYRELARRSSRVQYEEYGRSIQGRPLATVFIGSEQNLAARDSVRERIEQLTNVVEPLAEARLQELIADAPAIVSIFIVDTDEEAGVEVLQEVAYELATREDERARAIRDNVLVVMAPLTNPDSHARYVTWHKLYNVDGASVDPNAVENRAHWGMNTDGNAYGIDVNRDFGWFVSPEMQAFARHTMKWRPQLMLDIHSGPTVIFMPPFPPPYHPLWPQQAPKWWDVFSRRAGETFGRKGWSFNTREGYEGVTSVGFGLSWGMLGPSVSTFLYETFGGRPGRTVAFRRSDGTIATMRMAMDRHYEGIWTLLEVASERREELLRDAHQVVVDAVGEARSAPVRGVVIPAAGAGVDPDKVQRLIERLTLQGIRVERTKEPFSVAAADFFDLSRAEVRSFAPGSYVIDFVQPLARLARALLDPTIDQSDPQVLVPYDRRMPYYDTTWQVLPLMFGVPAYALEEPVGVGREIVASGDEIAAGRRPAVIDRLNRPEPPYAYLLPAGREASYRVAVRLMREGFRVRVFQSAMQIGDTRYARGTFAAIRRRNSEALGERLAELAEEHGGRVVEVAGPLTDAGVAFGDDRRLASIPTPAVAVVADSPVAHDHTYGGIRNVLEADFGFAFSPVMLSTINQGDLSSYSAVVLPHAGMDVRGGPGFSRGYRGVLNTDNLRRYVQGGGTLVAVQGAAEVIAADEVLGLGVQTEGWAEYTNGPTLLARWEAGIASDSPTMSWRPGLDGVGRHLLAAGYELPEVAVPGAYPVLLNAAEDGSAEVVARFSDNTERLMLDGFMLDSDRDRLAGRPFAVVQAVGRGRVIYFASDPTFRGHWYGLNLLFLNSLIFGPAM